MKTSEMFREIIIDLSVLRYVVNSCVKKQRYDINHDCENFFCGLLNILWNKSFINTNCVKRNSVGIDLADDAAHIAVQVTSNQSSKKIHSTLDKVVDNGLRKKYNEIYMLYIDSKPVFDKTRVNAVQFKFKDNDQIYDDDKYLIDVQDLLHEIEPLDAKRMEPIVKYVKENLGYYKKFLKDDSSLLDCDEFQSRKHQSLAGIANIIDEDIRKEFDDLYDVLKGYSSEERKVILCFMKMCKKNRTNYYVIPNTLDTTAFAVGLTRSDLDAVVNKRGDVLWYNGENIVCSYFEVFRRLLAIDQKWWHRLIVRLDFSLLDSDIEFDESKF